MQFLQYTDILAGQIPEEQFAELEEYAYAGIEKRESLGDNPYASGREKSGLLKCHLNLNSGWVLFAIPYVSCIKKMLGGMV